MRRCDPSPLALRPFADNDLVLAVGADSIPRDAVLGGAGRVDAQPSLTLYVPKESSYPIGSSLTVNLLSSAFRVRPRAAPTDGNGAFHLEQSDADTAPHIAESRLAFECRVTAVGSLEGDHPYSQVVVARVLSALQRWPRGCAIT